MSYLTNGSAKRWDLKWVVEGEILSSDMASEQISGMRIILVTLHNVFQETVTLQDFGDNLSGWSKQWERWGVRAVWRWTARDALRALPRHPVCTVSAAADLGAALLHPKRRSQPVTDWHGDTKCPSLGGTNWHSVPYRVSHEISPVTFYFLLCFSSPLLSPASLTLKSAPPNKSVEQEFLLTCAFCYTTKANVVMLILYTLCAFIITFGSRFFSSAAIQCMLHRPSGHFAPSELCLLTIWPTYIKDQYTLWFLMSQLSNSNLHILRGGECCTQRRYCSD